MQKAATVASELVTTTGTTTADICGIGGFANNSSGVYRARVTAREQGADQARSWDVTFAWRKNSGGTLNITGGLATLLDQGTLGALLWTVEGVAVSGNFYMRVKGGSGKTVDWAGFADCEWLEQ